MKKVIFVCLLSLSVCFSLPSAPLEPSPPVPAAAPVAAPNTNAVDPNTAGKKPEHNETAAAPAVTVKPEIPIVISTQNATATNTTQTSNTTSNKPNETKPTEKTNPTETSPVAEVTVKPEESAKDKKEGKPAAPVTPASNGTNADSKDKKNETTTPKGENVSPTAVPIQAKSRAFDGPSFIGGMILTLGLLAIGFMGFKYYKNQTERNYHTL